MASDADPEGQGPVNIAVTVELVPSEGAYAAEDFPPALASAVAELVSKEAAIVEWLAGDPGRPLAYFSDPVGTLRKARLGISEPTLAAVGRPKPTAAIDAAPSVRLAEVRLGSASEDQAPDERGM